MELLPIVLPPPYAMKKIDESSANYRAKNLLELEACYGWMNLKCFGFLNPWWSLRWASKNGDLELVEKLILLDKNLCFEKDSFGRTPLHIAAENGRIDVINLILKYCPESAKELTGRTMETCLDVAIKHNQVEVALHLLNWITEKWSDFHYLLELRDYEGNTDVQYSTSRKQFQLTAIKLAELEIMNHEMVMLPRVSPPQPPPSSYEMKKIDGYESSTNYSGKRLMLIHECAQRLAMFGLQLEIMCRLHVACKNQHLTWAEQLILKNRNLCLRKDLSGITPLHIAAQTGNIDLINLFLKYCPESVKELTATTMETCVHVAVKHRKMEAVLHLLKWIIVERPDFLYLLNLRDYEGNTALPFFTSNEELQTLIVLLSRKSDVYALNSAGFVALDISYDLPHSEKPHSENMDIGIDRILQEPTAMEVWDLTEQNIKHSDDYSHTGLSNISWDSHKQTINPTDYNYGGLSNIAWDSTKQKLKHSDDYNHGGLFNKSSDISTVMLMVGFGNVLLLIATLFATVTFQVPFHFLGSTYKDGNIQDSIMRSSFILLNSMVFIASVGVIIFLLHEFPLKPWPHISISALFGSYMLSLKSVSPNEAPALLFISIPILLVGMCGKTLWLCKPKSVLIT